MSGSGNALTSLPPAVSSLSSLQHLNVFDCRNLSNLRNVFGNLSSLQHLEVVNSNISSMPPSFTRLNNLQHLNLRGCKQLKRLHGVDKMTRLQQLNLSVCWALSTLTSELGSLGNLLQLNLRKCWSLPSLPSGIGYRSRLSHLDLGDLFQALQASCQRYAVCAACGIWIYHAAVSSLACRIPLAA